VPRRRHRTLLPHFLALICALALAYASLQPFAPWIAPPPDSPFFMFAPWPPRWTRFDLAANMLSYIPFGFFVALMPRRRPAGARLSVAVAAGAALSFAMETLQMFMPPRDANLIDLLGNTAGAGLGGLAALAFVGDARARRTLATWRAHTFVHGALGDVGLALIAVWIAAQVNPGIPLFATMYETAPVPGAVAAGLAETPDVAATLVEAAHSGFQLLGVGLVLALLLRDRRFVGGAVCILIGAALLVKGIAATVLLKPSAWEGWLTPGVSTGVAAGALALTAAIWLPRPMQVALAAIALLSSLLVMLLVPDLVLARAPLTLFNWSYGHLLNFNGLTRSILLAWPVAAAIWLFALAGRPGWGDPGARL
jgi:VanZ family protein